MGTELIKSLSFGKSQRINLMRTGVFYVIQVSGLDNAPKLYFSTKTEAEQHMRGMLREMREYKVKLNGGR